MQRLLFIFLDGVGIGDASGHNPFYAAETRWLPFYRGGNTLPDGTPVKAIDPMMGVDGIPQSATGQTTLFTGENVPEILQEHRGSYPNKTMRLLLKEKNIIRSLKAKGLDATFINVYPYYSDFFTQKHVDILEDGSFHFSDDFPPLFKRRISTTSCMMIVNGQPPYTEKDILSESAIYQDYSNLSLMGKLDEARIKGLPDMGEFLQLPEFSPEKAAGILQNAYMNNHFTLYEYFQTDLYGHRFSFDERMELVKKLDRLIGKLLSHLDIERDTLLITSDHGNLEDGTHRSHTLNPVPLVVWGNKSHELRESIHSLTDVAPAIEEFFATEGTENTEREK
ncbi:MAG: hypothetical protein GY757_10340 [bacterium]|nr:hypothetical protein [bacterium]